MQRRVSIVNGLRTIFFFTSNSTNLKRGIGSHKADSYANLIPSFRYWSGRKINIQGYDSVGFVDSGQGYGSLAQLAEVSGTGMEVLQNSQKFRVLWHGPT